MDELTATNYKIPSFVFGTSGLGNLYHASSHNSKKEIISACLSNGDSITFFDTAGKYGAGLALEVLGNCLEELDIVPSKVLISNKLGWYQTELLQEEPTFEPGVWKELKCDAVQRISYQGILDCFEQGNKLLGRYRSDFVSVHDPDEYLFGASDESEYEQRYNDIIEAYKALNELKAKGEVLAVGIGAKDWTIIKKIEKDVELDWVMIANSLTVNTHPNELIEFIEKLDAKNIPVINSAIFNGGFLTGSNFHNYREVDGNTEEGRKLLQWREKFFDLCDKHRILPAEACYNFCTYFSGIKSIAMSTTRVEKVAENMALATKQVPKEFWDDMYENNLLTTRII